MRPPTPTLSPEDLVVDRVDRESAAHGLTGERMIVLDFGDAGIHKEHRPGTRRREATDTTCSTIIKRDVSSQWRWGMSGECPAPPAGRKVWGGGGTPRGGRAACSRCAARRSVISFGITLV